MAARSNFEGPNLHVAAWRQLSVRQTPTSLRLTLDVPGLDERDIGVAIRDGVLHIRGEKRCENETEAELVCAAALKFAKSLSLPYEVDLEAASASVRDDVLTITLPRAAENDLAEKVLDRAPLSDRARGSAGRSRPR
jgi:HSP20 family protein